MKRGAIIGIIAGAVALVLVLLAVSFFAGRNAGLNEFLPEEIDLPENMSSINSVTENILQSLNDNNYSSFSKDFSDRIKTILNEQSFTEVRNLILETSGKYISKETPKSYEIEGYIAYDYSCEFEKEKVFVTISFSQDLKKVEGILFDSDNLREATNS